MIREMSSCISRHTFFKGDGKGDGNTLGFVFNPAWHHVEMATTTELRALIVTMYDGSTSVETRAMVLRVGPFVVDP